MPIGCPSGTRCWVWSITSATYAQTRYILCSYGLVLASFKPDFFLCKSHANTGICQAHADREDLLGFDDCTRLTKHGNQLPSLLNEIDTRNLAQWFQERYREDNTHVAAEQEEWAELVCLGGTVTPNPAGTRALDATPARESTGIEIPTPGEHITRDVKNPVEPEVPIIFEDSASDKAPIAKAARGIIENQVRIEGLVKVPTQANDLTRVKARTRLDDYTETIQLGDQVAQVDQPRSLLVGISSNSTNPVTESELYSLGISSLPDGARFSSFPVQHIGRLMKHEYGLQPTGTVADKKAKDFVEWCQDEYKKAMSV